MFVCRFYLSSYRLQFLWSQRRVILGLISLASNCFQLMLRSLLLIFALAVGEDGKTPVAQLVCQPIETTTMAASLGFIPTVDCLTDIRVSHKARHRVTLHLSSLSHRWTQIVSFDIGHRRRRTVEDRRSFWFMLVNSDQELVWARRCLRLLFGCISTKSVSPAQLLLDDNRWIQFHSRLSAQLSSHPSGQNPCRFF